MRKNLLLFLFLAFILFNTHIASQNFHNALNSSDINPTPPILLKSSRYTSTAIPGFTPQIQKNPSLLGRIAFIAQNDAGETRRYLYVMNADGSSLILLKTALIAAQTDVSLPQLSPSGQDMLFVQYPTHIEFSSLGNHATQNVLLPSGAVFASWSSDGAYLFVTTFPDGSIHQVSLERSSESSSSYVTIVKGTEDKLALYPSVSPDGKYMTFVVTGSNSVTLNIIKLEGREFPIQIDSTDITTVTNDVDPGYCAWLSDGSRFIYMGSKGIISVSPEDISSKKSIKTNGDLEFDTRGGLAISPDNKYLLFAGYNKPTSTTNLYLLDLLSSNTALMISNASQPSWVGGK